MTHHCCISTTWWQALISLNGLVSQSSCFVSFGVKKWDFYSKVRYVSATIRTKKSSLQVLCATADVSHRWSCPNNWFLPALWPMLAVTWLAGCCDRHCADCVSLRALALAYYCLVSSLRPQTHAHTRTNTHTSTIFTITHSRQKKMCLRGKETHARGLPTLKWAAHAISMCRYAVRDVFMCRSPSLLRSHHYLLNSHMSLLSSATLCRNSTLRGPNP